MVHHIKGDLLKSDCDIIAHCCNCQSVMGGGIALQIKNQLPGAYTAYMHDKRNPMDKLGSMCCATSDIKDFGMVYNLYGQFGYGRDKVQIDYTAFTLALNEMLLDISLEPFYRELKIGLPFKIGCDLAGGSWEVVSTIIERAFDKFDVDCYLYEFTP